MRRSSLKPHPKAKAKAERTFHKYICMRDKYTCFTCGGVGNEAGHFKHNRLDFDEDNLHCQCVRCNHFLSGNLGVYAIKLARLHSLKWVEDLTLRANTQSNKFSISELEEITLKYKEKTNRLVCSDTKDLPF